MLQVYTAPFRYSGPDRLDITVKSGDPFFAPTWGMVWGLKKGRLTWEQYENRYYALLGQRSVVMSGWLIHVTELLKKDRIVLVCFCPKPDNCHRKLLAEFLTGWGAEYKGEISP
jgi:uncharacterized protein YeaO (DUF488 family)